MNFSNALSDHTSRSPGRSMFFQPEPSHASYDRLAQRSKIIGSAVADRKFTQIVREKSFEEKIFDALASLKILVGQISMHLRPEERNRLFDELESKINVDDWHADDCFPKTESFRDFLKWMVFSGRSDWTSIGIADDGAIMVAWRRPSVLLTASFEGAASIRWTSRITSDAGESGVSAGRCTLRLFTKQAKFVLS